MRNISGVITRVMRGILSPLSLMPVMTILNYRQFQKTDGNLTPFIWTWHNWLLKKLLIWLADTFISLLLKMMLNIETGRAIISFSPNQSVPVPCNLETSPSLQTARPLFQWTTCTCVLWRDNFKENRENCHDFIVLYCVRNWEGISVVENLVRHNNRSFRANKLVIVSPNYKQENE